LQEYLGHGFRPDRVIVYFVPNDLTDNIMGDASPARPYFEIVGGKAELRNSPPPRSVDWQFRTWMQQHSLVYNFLHYYLRIVQHAIDEWRDPSPELADAPDETLASGETGVAQVIALREACTRMKRLCDEHRVELLIASEKTGPAIAPLRTICGELSIGLLDLSGHWRQHLAGPKPAPLQFRNDPHYNEAGHRLLAESIHAELERLPAPRK
jgi:hypothetical protein